MEREELFNKLVATMETNFPALKGSQFVGEPNEDGSIGMMVNTPNKGIGFIDVYYIVEGEEISIYKIVDSTTGKTEVY